MKKWNKRTYQEYLKYLTSLKDEKYHDFSLKLVSSKYELIGIRIPFLHKMAREISKTDVISFLNLGNNIYFEEVMIKGLVLTTLKDKELLLQYLDNYVSLIDNWSICDTVAHSLKIVLQEQDYWFFKFLNYLKSNEIYTIRFGLVILLNFYVKKEYLSKIFKEVSKLNTNAYYVNMAISWLLCECFIKYPEETLLFLKKNTLNSFTFNKTISKIRDSYRVSKEMKDYLLTLKKEGLGYEKI